jgi:hypothetical protein
MTRDFSDADMELFHELWAGTLFDIIHKVTTERPNWDEDEQNALIYMAIEALAEEWGVIEGDEDDAA